MTPSCEDGQNIIIKLPFFFLNNFVNIIKKIDYEII